jgi:6,7-dimethyl-8-ribityllumazine synthase
MDQTVQASHHARIAQPSSAEAGRIAFLQSCWHKEIVHQCRSAFVSEIGRLRGAPPLIDFFEVPGAFEIPLQAKLLARSGRYAVIVAAGFVVDGGIYRHEFVADAVIGGLMQVQIETEVPIISAVLTPQRFHAHQDHRRFFHQHFLVKGAEAAAACAKTLESLAAVRGLAA